MFCQSSYNVRTSVGWLSLVLALLNIANGAATNDSYMSHERQLYRYLMEDYQTSIRPVSRTTETVAVDLHLAAFVIEDLDEKNQAFSLTGFFMMMWKDAGLRWNPEDFNDLYHTLLSISDLWYPDILIRNSKSAQFAHFPALRPHSAIVHSNGMVFWPSKHNLETHCEPDLSHFPFDEHTCKVVVASGSHKDSAVNITSWDVGQSDAKLLNREIVENPKWKLMKVSVERNERRHTCCDDDVFSDVTYRLTIRRRSAFVTHLFVGPFVTLCLLTPTIFLLPPGTEGKMMLGIGVLIADTLLLGELIDYIPTAHPNLPLIAKYYVSNIVLASLSLVISAIVIGFWDKSSSRMCGPPAFFRLIFLGPMSTILCVKKSDFFPEDEISNAGVLEMNCEELVGTDSALGGEAATDGKRLLIPSLQRNAAKSEWRQLAVVFDRLFLVIYCVILATLTLSFARYI